MKGAIQKNWWRLVFLQIGRSTEPFDFGSFWSQGHVARPLWVTDFPSLDSTIPRDPARAKLVARVWDVHHLVATRVPLQVKLEIT